MTNHLQFFPKGGEDILKAYTKLISLYNEIMVKMIKKNKGNFNSREEDSFTHTEHNNYDHNHLNSQITKKDEQHTTTSSTN